MSLNRSFPGALRLCAVFLLVGSLAGLATPLSVDSVERNLKQEAAKLERGLAALGKLDPAMLPTPLPPLFATFQTGYFNVEGKYMSEVENLHAFSVSGERFLKSLPPGVDGKRPDFTDLLVALWKTSPDKRQGASNGYLTLDFFIHSHCSSVLIKKLTSDGSDLSKHMFARRLFSDYHMMVSQIHWLRQPHSPRPGKEPPPLVKAMLVPLMKIPGEKGRAVSDTLRLLGIEDLTAAIFTNHAIARLADPVVGRRILDLYDSLIKCWKPLIKSRRKSGAGYLPPAEGPSCPDLWRCALRVCDGSIDDAVELLGVFTTQHRTLVKTILPRCPTRESQFPLVAPLIRTSSNFFLVQELNLLTRQPDGTFLFAYPEGWKSDDPRCYHFWSEVFVTWSLLKKGHKPETARFVIGNLGKAYELYTLPTNLRFAQKSQSTLDSVLGGLKQDVKAHKMGCEFAISIWKNRPGGLEPGTNPTTGRMCPKSQDGAVLEGTAAVPPQEGMSPPVPAWK